MGLVSFVLVLALISLECFGIKQQNTQHHAEQHHHAKQGYRTGVYHPYMYMMQLYHDYKLLDMKKTKNKGYIVASVNSDDSHALYLSDSVLSLVVKDCHHVEERWTVTFDMSSLFNTGEIQFSEIRFRLPAFSASTRTVVELYHVQNDANGDRTFLGSIRATSGVTLSPWKVFNITNLLKHWVRKIDKSQRPEDRLVKEKNTSADQEGSGKYEYDSSRLLHHKISANQVMVLVFFKNVPSQAHKSSHTLMQTVAHSKFVLLDPPNIQSRRRKRNRMEIGRIQDIVGENFTLTAMPMEFVQRPLCRRVDMWVDFDQIGWNEWIVHPKRYNAYRCDGDCPVPLDESYNPTNHAYMQSLLKLYHPERVTCASCVPTRLSSLSMLYYEGDDVMLRHHEEMIVEECGCQ